ncbi:MAG: Fur family transcriptional regulator [Thermodesulfobacteriota bacterium]
MIGKKEILRRYIAEQGLKSTAQRDDIADVFFNTKSHISLDELLQRVKLKNPKIGYATVYRTMKLLSECGLAIERHFGDGQSRYEHIPDEGHHDHLICTRCGDIIEFEHKRIEDLQKEVAQEKGFLVTRHKLELYGLCKKCVG